MDDWQYHQDSRDSALSMGCFAVAAILAGFVAIAVTALFL